MHRLSSPTFPTDQLRGPRQHQRPRLPLVRQGPGRARQAHGGPPALRRLLLAHLLLAGSRRVRRGHVQPPVARRRQRQRSAPRAKREVAFDFVEKLDVPFYCFHDVDVMADAARRRRASRAASPRRSIISSSCRPRHGRKLLWGTANLFSHPRYMAGAATNPGPRGLRLRRDAGARRARGDASAGRRELRAVGRSRGLRDAAQHRPEARAGQFRPLPEPGRRAQAQDRLQGHDPDRAQAARADQAPVRLRHRDGVRLPASATAWRTRSRSTSRPTTRRSRATPSSTRSRRRARSASSARSTPTAAITQNGWDTDQFPNSVEELTLAMLEILRAGGFTDRRVQLRRQGAPPVASTPVDLFHGHIGGIDTVARGLLNAAALIEDGRLDSIKAERYAGWDGDFGKQIGGLDLAGIADLAIERALDPQAALGPAGAHRESGQPLHLTPSRQRPASGRPLPPRDGITASARRGHLLPTWSAGEKSLESHTHEGVFTAGRTRDADAVCAPGSGDASHISRPFGNFVGDYVVCKLHNRHFVSRMRHIVARSIAKPSARALWRKGGSERVSKSGVSVRCVDLIGHCIARACRTAVLADSSIAQLRTYRSGGTRAVWLSTRQASTTLPQQFHPALCS